jgi:hypothetical protein
MSGVALLVFLATLQTQPPTIAAPSDENVLGLLRRVPAFAATTGRSELRLTGKKMVVPQSEGKAHFFEFQWTEKGAAHTGLAAILHKSVGEGKPILVKGDPWGVASIGEDQDWDSLIADLRHATFRERGAMVMNETRMVISAEAGYQAAAGGYGELRCLAHPSECIPGYTGRPFLDEELASAVVEKNGYRRQFHAGPRMTVASSKAVPSALLKTFAYTAVPLTVGETGQRSFCGDSTGRVCALESGVLPAVTAGACPASCRDGK